MPRKLYLIFTLIFAFATSASATAVTREHKHAQALKPAHPAATAHSTKAHSAESAAARSRTHSRAAQTARQSAPASKPASKQDARTGRQGKAARAENRTSPHEEPARSAGTRRSRTNPRSVERIPEARGRRRQAEPAPPARIETASLRRPRIAPEAVRPADPEPAVEPAPKLEASVTMKPGAMPAPLKGSLESLERQNAKNDAEGLERILDEDDLSDRIANKSLVPVPVSSALGVNADLPETHRYCRPWTAAFLTNLSQEFSARFKQPLQVTSAVRTVEYQKQLQHVNGNATSAEGDIASPHLTGATIDIGKNTMSKAEIAWMREKLQALQLAGKLDVEEEFRQPCFHITVYKSYVGDSVSSPVTTTATAQTKKAQTQQ